MVMYGLDPVLGWGGGGGGRYEFKLKPEMF